MTADDEARGDAFWLAWHPGRERVADAAQVRELDRRAVEEFRIPSELLMEAAGRACADVAERLAPDRRPVAVLCGPGNNGGDGLVIARTLHNRGRAVRVVLVGEFGAAARLSSDTRANLERLARAGVPTELASGSGESPDRAVAGALEGAGLAVDALFGTGLARPVTGSFARALEAVRDARIATLAVDLPSGLDADSGAALGPLAPAAATVTFAVRKRGLGCGEGPRAAGRIEVAEIGIPRALIDPLDRYEPIDPHGASERCRD